MELQILENGDLRINFPRQDRNFLLEIPNLESNAAMYEIFDFLGLENTDYDWIEPIEISALTSAPILGKRDEDGIPNKVWWYPNYAISSPQSDFMTKGFTIFQKGFEE